MTSMPISPSTLQRRHAELGRIRLGYKATTSNNRTRPAKLELFRFTSPNETYIRDIAALYGGDAKPWDNGGKPEWEVFTNASTVPVIVVKGGLSQWMETWSGGGCVHRCDGEKMADGRPCSEDRTTVKVRVNGRDEQVLAHDAARPTTRVSVMLPELDAIGVWRLESKGWNAAAEIPAVAELAQYVGELVPAELHLVERRAIKDGQTSRFVVPLLDLKIGPARLREVVAAASGGVELEAPQQQRAALNAGSSGPQQQPDEQGPAPINVTPDDIASATREDVLEQMWRDVAGHQHQQQIRAAIEARVQQLRQGAGQQPDADGAVDAELVPDGNDDADAAWHAVLAAAGKIGMSTPDLEVDFEQAMGVSSAAATAAQMRTYIEKLGVNA